MQDGPVQDSAQDLMVYMWIFQRPLYRWVDIVCLLCCEKCSHAKVGRPGVPWRAQR